MMASSTPLTKPFFVVALLLASAPPVFAQVDTLPYPKKCVQPKGKLQFSADKEDIQSLLKRISQITCRNFIVSEDVKGKSDITIISHQPVTVNQAYAAFLAALEANNMALVKAGQYYKVVERKGAAKQALPMYEDPGELPYTDAQVTLLYELKYANKEAVQPLVRNLMSKSGDLQVVGGGLLILTDAASNIRRLIQILEKIDVTGSSSRMHIVDIQWAEAQEIAQKLQEIFGNATTKGGGGGAAARAKRGGSATKGPPETEGEAADEVSIDKIVSDDRTNKLIIISSLRAFRSIKEVIDILDVPQNDERGAGSQVYVHPLNNSDAQKVSSTLSNLAQGAQKNRNNTGKSRNNSKDKGGADAAELFEGEIKITADEATNSLVIVASPRDYRALKDVIEELDSRRPQVFVEAAIMEVNVNQNRQVALDAYTGLPATVPGLGTGLGVVANEGGQNLVVSSAQAVASRAIFEELLTSGRAIDPTQLAGVVDVTSAFESLLGVAAFQGPPVPGSQEIFGFAVPSFGFVLNALQGNSNVNVLSTPHVMTTDNEKAEISVGQRVPVVRGIAPISGGASNFGFGGLQQVAYEDVKLKFSVTPHVNVDNEVRIELEQEVSDLGGNVPVGNGLNQPIITNRSAKTTVVVGDQQTVVIGGLISDREGDSESKVPLLGDIPIIGWLFKNWNDQKAKTNLVLVLTPYVVRDEADFQKIYERKIRERRQFLETYYGYGTEYNPYIDYDKKTGPLGKLVSSLDTELMKLENGGPGLPGERLITPQAEITPLVDEDTELDSVEDVGENVADDDQASTPGAEIGGATDSDATKPDVPTKSDSDKGQE